MLNQKNEGYLAGLVVRAKEKCKQKYNIEIESPIIIDIDKTLAENRAIIIQTIQTERDSKLRSKSLDIQTSIKPKTPNSKNKELEEEKYKLKMETQRLEEERKVKVWKEQFKPTMILKSQAYFEMEKYIEMVCQGISNFCIIQSRGGFSKTFSTQTILKSQNVDYAYLNSFTSPLQLYNFLYDNSNGKVILIDDCQGLWSASSLNLLKNGTELGGKRIICWNSTTNKLEERDSKCLFNSRIILLTNKIPDPEKNADVQALLGRAFVCKLRFEYKEKLEIIQEVSLKAYKGISDKERAEVYEFLKRNTNEATKDLSIRTLIKCYKFYIFNKNSWRDLALMMLKVDKSKEIMVGLMNSGESVKDQEQLFKIRTGQSRATFFRIRKEIREG